MQAIYKSISSIPTVGKKYFIFFSIVLKLKIILHRAKLIYYLVVDDEDRKIIDKAWCIWKKIGEASSKSRITFICSNNIFAKVYNTVICRIYTLLYSIKLNIKLAKVFFCKQSCICGDNIGETKCLPFS